MNGNTKEIYESLKEVELPIEAKKFNNIYVPHINERTVRRCLKRLEEAEMILLEKEANGYRKGIKTVILEVGK